MINILKIYHLKLNIRLDITCYGGFIKVAIDIRIFISVIRFSKMKTSIPTIQIKDFKNLTMNIYFYFKYILNILCMILRTLFAY